MYFFIPRLLSPSSVHGTICQDVFNSGNRVDLKWNIYTSSSQVVRTITEEGIEILYEAEVGEDLGEQCLLDMTGSSSHKLEAVVLVCAIMNQ